MTQRTGKNPAYTYLSLGCSKAAADRMLHFARAQVGRPFSNAGMARSILWPRTSTGDSWFCAELVAAILQKGGLMSSECNPGAATPYGLYKMYSKQAAATANPYTLRAVSGLSFGGPLRSDRQPLLAPEPPAAPRHLPLSVATSTGRRRNESPPRASFRVFTSDDAPVGSQGIRLSLNSLRGSSRS